MNVGAVVPLASSFLVLGIVLLGVAAMVRADQLARNGAVGIRTRWTKADDHAWTAGHRAACGAINRTGALCLVFAVLIVLVALTVRGALAVPLILGTAAAGYLALAVGLVVVVRRANTGARGSGSLPR